ncbi:unnamed protein product, partial [Rotaria sp. Silwood2]
TQLAGHLTGIRHAGLQKICAALNLPPPLEEGRHSKRDKELLQVVQKFANESMSTAIQEAIDVAKSTDITVSGDGTWQTRGFSSKHGAADLISTCDSPKVVDIETCSKTCNVCLGAESLLQLGTPEARTKYDQIIINHDCGKNFDQPSGNMEASSILKMFRRSVKKYGVRYVKYIGDGDSKTFSVLKTEIPYKGEIFEKLCGYIGFYTENILISFDDERLHTANKEYMRKQKKLINLTEAIKDTTDEETHGISDADDVSETSDQQDENNDDFDDDDYDDVSSSAHTSFDGDETSHNNTDNEDDNNDDGSRQAEDLYYNPKSRKWKDSDEDN